MAFKVLFIYPNFRSETLIPPGITLLSRILKNHGITVDVFDTTLYGLDETKDYDKRMAAVLAVRPTEAPALKHKGRDVWQDFRDKVNSFSPDLLAMSCTENTFLLGVELLKELGRREVPVILGGSFATAAPRRALDFSEIDIVCIGEGEKPLLELCERMEHGREFLDVKGLWLKDRDGAIRRNPLPDLVDLDQNPTDFDIGLFDQDRLIRPMAGEKWRMTAVETIRGCPYHCTFCNSPGLNTTFDRPGSKYIRKKSLEKVREELLYYKEHCGAEYNFFWADTFLMMSKKEIAAFAEMYQDINLPFWIQTRVETITDWRLEPLKRVGLHRIAFGIENGHEEFRQKVLVKEFSNDEAVEKLAIVGNFGIPYSTNNMVGYPGETRAIAMETVRLNKRFLPRPDNTSCAIFAPYYGTPARDLAIKAGYMPPDVIAPGNGEDSILVMPQFPPEEIRGFRKGFSLYIGFPEERWPEIRKAEEDSSAGEALLATLQAEYAQKYFDNPVSQY